MKVAIMQPYFLPYIGYFQLINSVDEFVVYDNIEFTKKGWINRNRILVNGKDEYITLPIKKDSDYLQINQRYLADSSIMDKKKLLNKITGSYRKAPNYNSVYPLIEKCVSFEDNNLFNIILNSLLLINDYLKIRTPIILSSTIPIDHDLKAEKKVIEICRDRKAEIYINPIGGLQLYKKSEFKDQKIDLYFLRSNEVIYKQYNNEFVPWLSILDVMMFNSTEDIQKIIGFYKLE
jgi:hypothetical protein